ncbi:hypothetical protein Shal_0850 [Shewanella halifaxensis HAW-EB4]|uniref:Uncharacterized protein n=1 Tax=Shewanella halifaxensis (strain HAW-EB4) TaxID=458817 RepID=B0TUC5_SHEHH|nr:hypothetical protein [Shewanella halifaxensis]ABZ75425.1 hypothetical protein Shal_0850 [Shewanella halifaxensis HAW-EB4]
MKENTFLGFKTTPMLATLTFICGLCLFLEHTVDPDMNSTLTCYSDTYRVGEGFKNNQQLVLKNTGNGVEVALNFFKGEKLIHKLMAVGTVKKVKDSILSYEVSLASEQHLRGVLQAESESSLQDAIRFSELVLGDGKSDKFLIKVLEMNKASNVVTVQVQPGNGLWACKINKTKFS